MSGAWTGLSWADLEHLADYTAGVLPAAEADRVAELIRTDDRWAAAHAELVAAEPFVRAALDVAAEAPVSMPADVAARLDAALAEEVPRTPARRARPHPVVTARRRKRRSPALTRVAAAVLALATVSGVAVVARTVLSQANAPMMAAEDAGTTAERAGGSEPGEAPSPPFVAADTQSLAGARVLQSGTNYGWDSLGTLADTWPAGGLGTRGYLDGQAPALEGTDPLSGLATPDGLNRCLAAVRLVHAGDVVLVDFAQFEGEPALIVVVRNGTTSTVVAVGPRCGTEGADELGSVEVD